MISGDGVVDASLLGLSLMRNGRRGNRISDMALALILFSFTRINNTSKALAYVGYASHIPGQFIIDRTKSAGTRSGL